MYLWQAVPEASYFLPLTYHSLTGETPQPLKTAKDGKQFQKLLYVTADANKAKSLRLASHLVLLSYLLLITSYSIQARGSRCQQGQVQGSLRRRHGAQPHLSPPAPTPTLTHTLHPSPSLSPSQSPSPPSLTLTSLSALTHTLTLTSSPSAHTPHPRPGTREPPA